MYAKNVPITITDWIESNSECFIPPICNKLLYSNQLKVFFVGGPNQRNDYHIELGEEFFYQLRGTMHLEVIEHGRPRTIVIREGECFLLPAKIPHSPQRFADTMGLVIERERAPHELDGIRYYTQSALTNEKSFHKDGSDLTVQSTVKESEGTKTLEKYSLDCVEHNCDTVNDAILYERWFHCTDLGTQLAPIITQFKQSQLYQTGIPSSESCLRLASYEDDRHCTLCAPVNITQWLQHYANEIELDGRKAFCDELRFSSSVFVYGGLTPRKHFIGTECLYEIFLWQLFVTHFLGQVIILLWIAAVATTTTASGPFLHPMFHLDCFKTESSEAEVRDCASDVKLNGNEHCDKASDTLQLRAGQCFLLNPEHRQRSCHSGHTQM